MPSEDKKQEGRKGGIETSWETEKKRPAETQRGRKWWMWGSQQHYIPYLCLVLSPLSAAKCQCQSNLCSSGMSPSTAGLWMLRQHHSQQRATPTWHNTRPQIQTHTPKKLGAVVVALKQSFNFSQKRNRKPTFFPATQDGKSILKRFH